MARRGKPPSVREDATLDKEVAQRDADTETEAFGFRFCLQVQ